MPGLEPEIDLAKINFPFDRLDIKSLRERFPDRFDRADRLPNFFMRDRADHLNAELQLERDIAKWAFDKAMGRPPRGNNPDEEGVREWLAEGLVEYGLATGPHHAEQLIRDIEAQAAAQAKGFGPPPLP